MQEIDIKAIFNQHRKACILLVVFVLALLFGFSGGRREVQNRDRVRFKEVYQEMRRVLRILEPVLKPAVAAENKKSTEPVINGLFGLVARGIIGPLPDGSWNEDATVTRGEALFYFGRMLQALEDDLVQPPLIFEIRAEYTDILAEHWLNEFLPRLAGIGALAQFKQGRLNPDAALMAGELRAIGSAMIDYLGSNLLIVSFDGRSAKLTAKGAIQGLKAAEWSYSFNRRDWFQVGKDGELEPEFNSGRTGSIFFRHPSYRDAGPILVKENVSSLGMIKLQRNYADFAGNRVLVRANNSVSDSEEERERIRNRLAQIRERNQQKKSDEISYNQPLPKNLIDNADAASSQKNLSEIALEQNDSLQPDSAAIEAVEIPADTAANEIEPVSYEGRVVDALNNEPLKGAVVIIAARQYTADSDGKFSFMARPHAVLDLTAYTEGYEALKIRHRAGYRSGMLTLTLKPVFASCVGRVTSFSDERPVARALVKVGNRATRTSVDGRFTLKGIRPGFHQVSVYARDYMEAHEIAHISAEPGQVINLQLRPVYSEDQVFADSYQDS
ncbi:MAG: hypothetical protein ACD_39C00864G0005 [uncultured bacterium]|nr:MAG: hypothetical protein ACD_39C00864G0005 [uncultured bacterium]